ncbi:hypothetical protein TSOC_002009 [Tetrabaena socialis]|uniref:Uncharacterized protein n=1 Tax=Tetrabaena socialis TaxID=47790 RepID=A0A2J8AF86_9CHLO|nr:hypothetical protein TSOC_002009 [Tetrabaena socialis]|eukprot:PNH11185.1 hypothetical protein TSOC_002009 [Tetrabaena socialis]
MPPKKKDPVVLKPLQLVGVMAALPVTLAFFIIGALGIAVLLDTEGTSSLSRSPFGVGYRKLTQTNPFFSAMFVNGGMIGSLFCIVSLLDHVKAKKKAQQAPAIAAAAAVVAEPETKKDK